MLPDSIDEIKHKILPIVLHHQFKRAALFGSLARGEAGIASGINNAVSRVAAVLAIAVLGVVMLTTFDLQLDRRLTAFNLAPEISQELDKQRLKLAATEVPSEIDADARAYVRLSIDQSFAAGFRLVMHNRLPSGTGRKCMCLGDNS